MSGPARSTTRPGTPLASTFPPATGPSRAGWCRKDTQAATAALALRPTTGTAHRHHIAFINDISTINASGFTTNSVGANSALDTALDYFAVVGDIAQNSAGRERRILTMRPSTSSASRIGTRPLARIYFFRAIIHTMTNRRPAGQATANVICSTHGMRSLIRKPLS